MVHQATVTKPPGGSPPRMSYEEYLEWLDDETHAEWVKGEIVLMSPVSIRHGEMVGFLSALIRLYAGIRRPGIVLNEPVQMKTGPGLPGRSPDILYLAEEHRGRLRQTYVDGPADLVVEIVSPESARRDRVEKLAEYEEGGVLEYWIIDPEQQIATFYTLSHTGRYEAMLVADGLFRSRVLEGLWLKLEWLWQEPLPTEISVMREWGFA